MSEGDGHGGAGAAEEGAPHGGDHDGGGGEGHYGERDSLIGKCLLTFGFDKAASMCCRDS